MQMPGRGFSVGDYRFGFQGQEGDDEILGEGNAISYKYRVHDARIGRFLSIDPLAPDYPWNSPYAFSENKVIDHVELEGLEGERANDVLLNTRRYYQSQGRPTTATEVFVGVGLSIFGIAATYYGIPAVAGYLLEEGVEEVAENLFGVPILIDPIDGIQYIMKNGLRTTLKEGLTQARKYTYQWDRSLITAPQEVFDKYKKSSREKLRRNLGATRNDGKQAHHYVSLKLTRENRVLQDALDQGFDINKHGDMLDLATHKGPHNDYSAYVSRYINKNYDGNNAKDWVEKKLIPHLKSVVDKAKSSGSSIDDVAKKLSSEL